MVDDTSRHTIKKTVEVTFTSVTKFYFIDGGKMYIGYLDTPFESEISDEKVREMIEKADFVEMGYGSNVCFILPKLGYHSSNDTVKTEDET